MEREEEEKEDGEFEEKLPKNSGRKTMKVKREEMNKRDKFLGTQTMIDKSLGVGTKTFKILAINGCQRRDGPKPSSK